MEQKVILVDKNDNEVGVEEKLQAHKQGKLHRAFSIFVFNKKGELMLQNRAEDKYHSGGLWSNTCCSHPVLGESLLEFAHRRLKEEMGFDCALREVFSFVYKKEFENGLTEHEYDHVLFGAFDGEPQLNPEEASDWKWMPLLALKEDINIHPARYTYWLKEILSKHPSLFEEK